MMTETAVSAMLLAYAVFPGTATDLAGGNLGGISSLRWNAQAREITAVTDRGPGDGNIPYTPRIQRFSVHLTTRSVSLNLKETILLKDEAGLSFSGLIVTTSSQLDSEGLVFDGQSGYWISEEYGPSIFHFNASGQKIGALTIPDEYKPSKGRGRTENQGFESLCASPDRRVLTTILQSPLAQEGGRGGTHTRLMTWSLSDLKAAPRSYQLPRVDPVALKLPIERSETGINECLSVSSSTYLILERDSRGLAQAEGRTHPYFKSIVRVNRTPDGRLVRAGQIDLLAPLYAAGFTPETVPPKFESLELGPVIDGKQTLWVAVDNDFKPNVPTYFFLFALR